MIKVVVGSKNPVKISAAKTAICEMFALNDVECVGINAPSGVPEQPMTNEDTQLGAINRVKYCQQHAQADYYVAFEGGVDQFEYGPATFAYVAVANQEHMSIGRSCQLPLPPLVYQALQKQRVLKIVSPNQHKIHNDATGYLHRNIFLNYSMAAK